MVLTEIFQKDVQNGIIKHIFSSFVIQNDEKNLNSKQYLLNNFKKSSKFHCYTSQRTHNSTNYISFGFVLHAIIPLNSTLSFGGVLHTCKK